MSIYALPKEILQREIISQLSPRSRRAFAETSTKHHRSVKEQIQFQKNELIDKIITYEKVNLKKLYYEKIRIDYEKIRKAKEDKYRDIQDQYYRSLLESLPVGAKNDLLFDVFQAIHHDWATLFVRNVFDENKNNKNIMKSLVTEMNEIEDSDEFKREFLSTFNYDELVKLDKIISQPKITFHEQILKELGRSSTTKTTSKATKKVKTTKRL